MNNEEANPASYRSLIKHRPTCLNINALLCDVPKDFVWLKNTANPAVDGIEEFMSHSFRNRWHHNASTSAREVIGCVKLSSILKAFHVSHIDLWVLDVEGAEMSVLRVIFNLNL